MTETALAATLDRLLAAMCAHDGGLAPLAADVRFTENGQPLAIGDGMWRTLTRFAGDGGATGEHAPSPWRIDIADPSTGTALFFGATVETTTPGMLLLRIAVRQAEIAEIEAVIVRLEIVGERGGTVTMFQPRLLIPFDPAGFAGADPALGGPVRGKAEREALIGAVDAYLDAVERDTSAGVPLAEDAVRRDNGVRASDNPAAPPFNPAVSAYRPNALSCAAQIDAGLFRRISRVRGRRHLIVDLALGLVASVALFDQNGRLREMDVPGVGTVPLPGLDGDAADQQSPDELFGSRNSPNMLVPTTELVAQLARIEDGRIVWLEAITRGGPYGMTTGW